MTDKQFFNIYRAALAQPDVDMFIGECRYHDYFDDVAAEPDEIAAVLRNIHHVAHMTIRELIAEAGLTQTAFAQRFCIPLRTVQNWCGGQNKCTDYDKLMAAEILGVLKR